MTDIKEKANNWQPLHNPVSITAENWKAERGLSLFRTRLEKMLKLTKSYSVKNNNERNESLKYTQGVEYNVISVVGERGSGKTSILESYKNILDKDRYYVFDIVNPDLFESDVSILLIYVTELYKIVEENYDEIEKSSNLTNVLNDLEKIIRLLIDIQRKNKYLEDGIPSLEFLKVLSERLDFKGLLKKLTQDVLGLLNEAKHRTNGHKRHYEKFVLIIDDVDLSPSHVVYQLIEEVSKYLSSSIDIIFSYREAQLHNVMLDYLIKEQEHLLDLDFIDNNELQLQASRMIDKLIPANKRVYLHTKEEILDSSIKTIHESLDMYDIEWLVGEKNENLYNTIYTEIFLRTNLDLRPIDKKEDVGLFMPNSLRGIIQLMEFIDQNMRIDNQKSNPMPSAYLHNIQALKIYILMQVEEQFTLERKQFIKNWLSAPIGSKNYILYNHFFVELEEHFKSKNKLTDSVDGLNLKDAYGIEPYNVSLGDVIAVFDEYKFNVAKNTHDNYFIYILKILYSIELSLNLTKAMEHYNDKNEEYYDALSNYLDLINRLPVPEDFNFYTYTPPTDSAVVHIGNLRKEIQDKQLDSEEEYINQVKKYLLYSPLTINSDIAKNISAHGMSLRYRNYYFRSLEEFNFMNPGLRDTNKYRINPFSYLGNKEYIEETIEKQLDIQSEEKRMLLLNNILIFDYIFRLNFSRRSEKNPVMYTLNQISNHVFKGKKELIDGGDANRSSNLIDQFVKDFTDPIKHLHITPNVNDTNEFTVHKYVPPYNKLIDKISGSIHFNKKVNIDEKDEELLVSDLIKIAENENKNGFINLVKKITEIIPSAGLDEIYQRLSQSGSQVRKREREEVKNYIKKYQKNLEGLEL